MKIYTKICPCGCGSFQTTNPRKKWKTDKLCYAREYRKKNIEK